MISWTGILIAALTGIGAGIFFFGGLWITVNKGLHARWPALWFLLSYLVRIAGTTAAFYYAGAGDWRRFLACLCGFLIIKFASAALVNRRKAHAHKVANGT